MSPIYPNYSVVNDKLSKALAEFGCHLRLEHSWRWADVFWSFNPQNHTFTNNLTTNPKIQEQLQQVYTSEKFKPSALTKLAQTVEQLPIDTLIQEERFLLTSIHTMLKLFPNNQFNDQILKLESALLLK